MMKKAALMLVAGLVMFALGIPALAAGPLFDGDHAEVRYGSVTIDAIHGLGIAAGVDSLPLDGEIDLLIVLQSYGSIPSELPIVIPDARVLVKENGAVIADNHDAVTVGLFLGERVPEEERDRMVNGFASPNRRPAEELRYLGFGLSAIDANLGDFPSIQRLLADPDSGNPFASRAPDCQSGGPGATSCSLECTETSSCSVTCGDGLYACCYCRAFPNTSVAICRCEAGGGGSGGGGGGSGGGGNGCTNDGSGCSAACMSCRPDY